MYILIKIHILPEDFSNINILVAIINIKEILHPLVGRQSP